MKYKLDLGRYAGWCLLEVRYTADDKLVMYRVNGGEWMPVLPESNEP